MSLSLPSTGKKKEERSRAGAGGEVYHEGRFILGSADRMGPARYEVSPAGSCTEYSVTI